MTSDIFLGIDNGKSGAIAVIKGDTVIDVLPYPVDNPCMIFHFLQKYKEASLAAIEESFMSTAFAGATANGYECQGRYLMCLDLLNMKYVKASPRVKGWRYKLGFQAKGRQNLKKESVDVCLERFKNATDYIRYEKNCIENHKRVKTFAYNDNIADSILLAQYAQKLHNGEIK